MMSKEQIDRINKMESYLNECVSATKDLSAGVLSEDLVYDEITDIRDVAFQMLELATDILKNRI